MGEAAEEQPPEEQVKWNFSSDDNGKTPRGPPVASVDGNWACLLCKNVNYAVRDVCNRCQSPRDAALEAEFSQDVSTPPPAAPLAARGNTGPPVAGVNGNWACMHCRNVDFAARDVCNRCQMPKPPPQVAGKRGGAPVAGVDGNWACSHCGNVNFPTREACNRCQTPRADAEGELEEPQQKRLKL